MLGALLAYFPEGALSFVTVFPFSILASTPIRQEALGIDVVVAPRRWPWFQLPVVRSQNTPQTALASPVKADK